MATHPPSRYDFVEYNAPRGRLKVYQCRQKFSAMAIDQAHEQNNAMVKGEGGAVG